MTNAFALLVPSKGSPFQEVEVEISSLQPEEVLVKIVATSICATDVKVQHGKIPLELPAILGHEGSGVVIEVGHEVDHVRPGDHVVLSYDYCGKCRACQRHEPYRCSEIGKRNFGACRPDGTHSIRYQNQSVSSNFFGQSSFCNPAIVQARSCVKVESSLPLEVLCTLGCGFQTGAGSVFNLLDPAKRQVSSLAVWGCGGVGCAAIMAAKVLHDQNPQAFQHIIAIDINESRLDLAKELGATDVINISKQDVKQQLHDITDGEGPDAGIDCTGIIEVINEIIKLIGSGGIAISVGGPSPGLTASVEVFPLLLSCKSYVGCHQGNSDSHKFIPFLADLYAKGKLPIEKLQKQYKVSEINSAINDMETGLVIKPVLLWN